MMSMKRLRLGATGKFPRGKIHDSDEGELQMAITEKDGNVMIVFGKPVAWLGLPRDIALKFADKIREKALELPSSS